MFDDYKQVFDQVKMLSEEQSSAYITYLVVDGIRDLAYYAIVGLVAWVLGRRLIQGVLAATREASRERA
jgi:hypothetical protein